MPVAIRPGGPGHRHDAGGARRQHRSSPRCGRSTIKNTGNPDAELGHHHLRHRAGDAAQHRHHQQRPAGRLLQRQLARLLLGPEHRRHRQPRVTTLRANGFAAAPNTALTTTQPPAVSFSIYADASSVAGRYAARLRCAAAVEPTQHDQHTQRHYHDQRQPAVEPDRRQCRIDAARPAAGPLLADGMAHDQRPGQQHRRQSAVGVAHQLRRADRRAAAAVRAVERPLNLASSTPPPRPCPPSCRAPSTAQPAWISFSSTSGALGFAGQTTTDATFNAAGLAARAYHATLCLTSNATNAATLPVPLGTEG